MIRKLLLTTAILLSAAAGLTAAKVDSLTINSVRLPRTMDIRVIVPDVDKPSEGLPCVYLLNGYSGDCDSWLKLRPDLPELADRYGFVLVMPSGMDSWYLDSPVRPDMQMASFFTKELIPSIDALYDIDPTRRGITGLSMGGHGALTLAMDNPGLFAAAASMSGGVDIRPFGERWKIKELLGPIEEYPERWDAATAATRVDSLKEKNPDLKIFFDCGEDDFFRDVNVALHESLLKAGFPHDYRSAPGSHTGEYWALSILYHLVFFNEALAR